MLVPRRWRLDAVSLGIGLCIGVAIAYSAGRSRGGLDHAVAPSHGATYASTMVSPPPDPVDGTNEALSPHDLFKAGAAAKKAAWKQVAAAYLSDGNGVLARGLMQQLSPQGMRKLALALAAQPRSPRTLRALKEVFNRWAQTDPLNALAQAQALPNPLSIDATYEAMQGFAVGAPAQAVAYFSAPPSAGASGFLRDVDWRDVVVGNALRAWAEQDPAAAARYLADASAEYTGYSFQVAENWVQQDPAAALDWASRLTGPDQKKDALRGIVCGWAKADPQAAASYVLGVADDASRKDFSGLLVRYWSMEDPSAAARWTLAQSGDVQVQAALPLIQEWSLDDPAAAAAWAAQLPEGNARDAAYSQVALCWTASDRSAAESWLNGLAAGDTRDAAVASYATSHYNHANFADVLNQVQTIHDPATRDDTLVTVLNNWLGKNPQSAQQWIAQAGLPATVVGKLKGG